VIRKNPQLFFEIAKEVLASGNEFRFKATGRSMQPFILDGDILTISPIGSKKLKSGQIAFYFNDVNHLLAHRIHKINHTNTNITYLVKGDGLPYDLEYIHHEKILGFAIKAERNIKTIHLNNIFNRYYPLIFLKTNVYKIKIKHVLRRIIKKLKTI
jgi:signal peptidase I